jgi:adenosylmethionine-8-amino-7-oxononanoate aminotransferase
MSTSLVLRDKASIWHPFTQQLDTPPPIPIVSGRPLSWSQKTEGIHYAISSWWVNLHGHAHPYIAQRIYEQASN